MLSEESGSPATLVAIAVAARRTGDRKLESQARRELETYHGIMLRFTRGHEKPIVTKKGWADHAQ